MAACLEFIQLECCIIVRSEERIWLKYNIGTVKVHWYTIYVYYYDDIKIVIFATNFYGKQNNNG